MSIVSSQEFTIEHLKDIYDSEIQLIDAVTDMRGQASSDDIQQMMDHINSQTQEFVEKLEIVGEKQNIQHDWIKSAGVEGLVQQHTTMFNVIDDALLKDNQMLASLKSLLAYMEDKYETFGVYLASDFWKEIRDLVNARIASIREEHLKVKTKLSEFSDALGD